MERAQTAAKASAKPPLANQATSNLNDSSHREVPSLAGGKGSENDKILLIDSD